MRAQIPRAFCLFSAMPIACFLLKNGMPQKMPVPSPGTLTGDSNSRVATLFPSSFPVLPVAAPAGWNLPALVSLMIHALPPQATSAVYSHIRGNRSEQARKHAQQTFGDAIGKSFDDAVARFSFPARMLQLLRKAGTALSTC